LRHRRRFVLFVSALAVPCLVLAALSYRIVRQDAELAKQRAIEERTREVEQVYKDALNRLEQIKLRVAAGQPPEGVVVVRPEASKPLVADGEIELGERAEFAANDLTQALAHYRQALAVAEQPAPSAYARLLLARALYKSGKTAEAEVEWHILLNTPSEITDEYGIPFALYAGERLKTLPPGILDRLESLSTTALYLLRSLTGDARIPERIAWNEKVEPIAVKLRALAGRYPLREVWTPFDEPAWLGGEGEGGILVAVRATDVLASFDAQGVELGTALPGVKVRLPAPPPEAAASHALLYLALTVVAGTMLLGGFLLWRDLQREAAVAELRGQFVSSVSHELKTPLTAIRMFAETLRLRGSTDGRLNAEYLDTMIHESERLTRLVDNILDFSKIERGHKFYNFEPVLLSDVVAAAARTMQYPLSQSGFRLVVESDGAIPRVRADRDALEQAVLNLLTNAMKYSGEAREITLRLRREDGQAVIEIEDHGIGIPEEHQQRIFERFFRSPLAESQAIPGAGLGLTLAAQTARAHSGSITVHSKPGAGSTFSLRLPLEEATS